MSPRKVIWDREREMLERGGEWNVQIPYLYFLRCRPLTNWLNLLFWEGESCWNILSHRWIISLVFSRFRKICVEVRDWNAKRRGIDQEWEGRLISTPVLGWFTTLSIVVKGPHFINVDKIDLIESAILSRLALFRHFCYLPVYATSKSSLRQGMFSSRNFNAIIPMVVIFCVWRFDKSRTPTFVFWSTSYVAFGREPH